MSQLASEKVVVSAPLSFSGSARRVWKMTRTDNILLKWLLLIPIAMMLICMAWSFVICWYMVIFGLFGIFVIPYRIIRRSMRKEKRNKLQHRELLEAMHDKR